MTKCFFTPSEAKIIGNISSPLLPQMGAEVCPELSTIDSAARGRLKSLIDSKPFAVAYLWREDRSFSALDANNIPAEIGSYGKDFSSERCNTLLAYSEGRLSQVTVKYEEEKLGKSVCDANKELERQDQFWLRVFEQNQHVLLSPESHRLFRQKFAPVSLSASDMKLIGTLYLISEFLSKGLKIRYPQTVDEKNPRMDQSVCTKIYDCNTVTTRVIDLLRLSRVEINRVEIVVLDPIFPSNGDASIIPHVTLRITLERGFSFYFDAGINFIFKSDETDWLSDLYRREKPDLNLNLFKIDVKPAWQMLGLNLGEVASRLIKKDDIAGAIEIDEKILKMDPESKLIHYRLGTLFSKQKNYPKAIEQFRRALELDPLDYEAHTDLGSALYDQGNKEEGIAEYRKALEISPQFHIASQNLQTGLLGLGLELLKKGNPKAAAEKLGELVKLDPTKSNFHNDLGVAYIQLGEIDKAVKEFKEAARLDPKKSSANLDRALTKQAFKRGFWIGLGHLLNPFNWF